MMEKARKAFHKEINIIKIVRKLRYFKLAYNLLLPKETRNKLKNQSHYVLVDSDNIISADNIHKHELSDTKANIQI